MNTSEASDQTVRNRCWLRTCRLFPSQYQSPALVPYSSETTVLGVSSIRLSGSSLTGEGRVLHSVHRSPPLANPSRYVAMRRDRQRMTRCLNQRFSHTERKKSSRNANSILFSSVMEPLSLRKHAQLSPTHILLVCGFCHRPVVNWPSDCGGARTLTPSLSTTTYKWRAFSTPLSRINSQKWPNRWTTP